VVSPRWRKLRGDLRAMKGRLALMVIALALSVSGFGTVLGARTVLRREITTSYLSSRPADATLELGGDVTASLLAEVRARADIADADAREVLMARVRSTAPSSPALHAHMRRHGGGGSSDRRGWQRLQLFVVDDFAALRLNVFRRESGAWPPPRGAMLLERSAVPLIGGTGATVMVKTPHGAPQAVAIAGIVHDTGLAPAWQERKGYGYITRETLAALGEPPALHELRVRFRPAPVSGAEVEAAASALASWLVSRGHPVDQIRVPALRAHPHQAQMNTVQTALLVFSLLLLLLCAVLIATLIGAMLARQVREIGVMKAVGARTRQLASMYTALVVAIGAVAFAIALPLAYLGAHAMIEMMGARLNLGFADRTIPGWVFAVEAGAAIAVPLACAIVPIRRACRLTVRAALAQHGTRSELIRPSLVRLPMSARNALRRPARLALTVGLLAAGGTMSTTAWNVKRAYQANLARMPQMWHHDVELQTSEPVPVELARTLAAVPGVRTVEPWGFAQAAFARSGAIDLVHTYPDQGHGSFPVYGVPVDTTLATLPLVAGRWLRAGDTDAIVVGNRAGLALGARVGLSLEGTRSSWTVVGVVDTVPAGGGYVTADAFARATHTEGAARTFRVATRARDPHELAGIVARLEDELDRAGASVDGAITYATLRGAMDAHVLVMIDATIALAAIVALVGLFGLGAITSVGIVERTRELGMMKAVGATERRIVRLIVGEALFVGAASWIVTIALALPLTALVDGFLGELGFLAPRFVVSPVGFVAWLAVSLFGSALASVLPARRAARLTVREALAEI